MNIQPINNYQNPNPNFGRFIIQAGSFETLKRSVYFPPKNSPNYSENLLNFYKKLNVLKKSAEDNDLYHVVIKPDLNSKLASGKIVIENNEHREQSGFTVSFDKLLRIDSKEPKNLLTKEDEPNFFKRFFKNRRIKQFNNYIKEHPITMEDILNTIFTRIEHINRNADALTERSRLREKLANVNKIMNN